LPDKAETYRVGFELLPCGDATSQALAVLLDRIGTLCAA
jgi:hypothetical protein